MRGRKIDHDFLSKFISDCIENNNSSSEEILKSAKNQISLIDQKIKEVESLKPIRCKLLDVIYSFEKKQSLSKRNLDFFNIQNQHICKYICGFLSQKTIILESLYDKKYQAKDIIFCVKQLLERKIISRIGNYLLKGELFNEYLTFQEQNGYSD